MPLIQSSDCKASLRWCHLRRQAIVKVLHSLSWIKSGGVEVAHLAIARHLQPPAYEHLFLCLSAGGSIPRQLEQLGATVVELGEIRSILSPGRYRDGLRITRQWQPDLIHGAVMEGNQLAAALGVATRTPTIVEESSDPADRRLGGHLVARSIYSVADRCIAVSPFVGRYLTDSLRLPARRVKVVTNGVRTPVPLDSASAAATRREVGFAQNDVVVGTVCRLDDDHKRVSDLIRAVDLLGSKYQQLRLLVVGDGPDAKELRSQVDRSPFSDRTVFVGEQIPADPYYAIMDVFSLVSSREAFGLVAAEAMHARLPVVATAVGGLASVVSDGVTGFLVPPRDPGALAAALEPLLRDHQLRARMGTAGRSRAEELYGDQRYADEIARLYEAVLRDSRRTRERPSGSTSR
jgi:L-malate glycosyltransferase